jgi:mercuric ion transport protein
MKTSRVAVTSGGSLITALLSFLPLSCCIFPVAFSFLGAGGLAFAMSLMPYRSYFVALTLVFLGVGFYFAYRSEKVGCAPGAACDSPRSRKLQRISLWIVTALTLILLAFPYVIPSLPIEWIGN